MPYPGVPKELTPKMDRCVTKVMKDGKSKSQAIAICKTSILSQREKSKKEKEEDEQYKTVVEKKETVTRAVFFSNSPVKENTINAGKEGKLLKNVEIFKAGTYRNTEFKISALDKMVANFHYLKSLGIFPNVPVRADHPAFFGIGGVIDKVGGYIADLRREGKKLVADFRITSQSMWDKIVEGSYVSRSAEIGTYDDNEGTIYSPILYGVAWVDIPQVEGLSPKFSYSKNNQDIELINLNNLINMEIKNEDVFPPKDEEIKDEPIEETPKEEAPIEAPKEETPKEEIPKEEVPKEESPVETPKEELSKAIDFEKAFPTEFAELKKLRQERDEFGLKERDSFVDSLELSGKILPAQKDAEKEFARSLTAEQYAKYKTIKESSKALVSLDKEEIPADGGEKPTEEKEEKTAEQKADEFLEETK